MLACGLTFALGGCGLLDLLLPADESNVVLITGVDGLAEPLVSQSGLYRPTLTFPIEADNPAAGEAAGFLADLALPSPERLRMRLIVNDGALPITLLNIAPPANGTLLAPAGWELPLEARQALRGGTGVYWLADATATDARVGVVLPNGWSEASVRLQLYTTTTADGHPVTPTELELAHDFFYLAAVGDSVVWGNGLAERDKFSRRVASEIQQRTQRRVVLQVHAISGARIVPDPTDIICRVHCNGEVQQASTSVMTQVDLLVAPEALELVLVDGCINDIGVSTILSPMTLPDDLASLVQSACHDEMVKLLEKVRAAAPAAAIVVSGYYPILSAESSPPEASQYFAVQSVDTATDETDTLDDAVSNATAFYSFSTQALAAAVQDANPEGTARIALADAGFGPENALFASDPLLWGLTANRVQQAAADQGLTLYPEDPLASLRAGICFRGGIPDPLSCLYASVGHPNPAGAERFADAIIAQLAQLGVIPQ